MPLASRAQPGGPEQPPALQQPPADHQARIADPKRLGALAATGLMDSAPEAAFDRFTKLAARLLGTDVALISLVDDHRQFFKSGLGLADPWASRRETPLTHSFCQYAVTTAEPLIIADAREHPFLRNNLAIEELAVVAYAGVPLVTSQDEVLGALCVVDSQPRPWSDAYVAALRDLAALTMTEIELRSQLENLKALQVERSKQRVLLTSILDSIEDSIVVTGSDGNVLLTNPAARQHRPPETLQSAKTLAKSGIFLADGVTPLAPEQAPSTRALAGEGVRDLQLVWKRPGVDDTFHSVNASPLRDASGAIFGAVSVGRDVTTTHAQQRALARNEAILRGVVKNLPNGAVLLFDHDLRYLMADGEVLLGSIGFKCDDMMGRTLYEIASPQGLAVAERAYRGALAGQTQNLEVPRGDKVYALTIVPVRDERGDVISGLALVYDVTSHKRGEALARKEANEVRSLSVKDELTQLYNRRGFLQLASERLATAQRMARPALLFFVDLNGMKQINDQLGHEQGDRALIETADVLRATCRSSDVIARLGGDEFVALLLDGEESHLASFSERVQREINTHNAQPDRAYRLSASIGGAAYDPRKPEQVEALLARADALMYEQKRLRKARGQSLPPRNG